MARARLQARDGCHQPCWDRICGRRWRRSLAVRRCWRRSAPLRQRHSPASPPSVIIVLDGSGSMWRQHRGDQEPARSCWRGTPCAARWARSHRRPASGSPPSAIGAATAPTSRCCARPSRSMHSAPPIPLEKDQPTGARTADAGAARGGQVARAGSGPAQPGPDPRRCRQLPAERLRGRGGACGALASPPTSSGLGLKPDDVEPHGVPAAGDGRAALQCAQRRADRHHDRGGAAARRAATRHAQMHRPPRRRCSRHRRPIAAAIPADAPPGLYLRAAARFQRPSR